jgi:hypothetical protein
MISPGTLYRLSAGHSLIFSTHPFGTGGIQNNSKKLYGDILILFLETYSDPAWGTNTAKVLVDGEVGYVSLIGLKKVEQ